MITSTPIRSHCARSQPTRRTLRCFRLLLEPDQGNGLDEPSRIMVDKVTTVRRSKLGTRVGVLDDASVLRLNRALVVFLGIASSVSSE